MLPFFHYFCINNCLLLCSMFIVFTFALRTFVLRRSYDVLHALILHPGEIKSFGHDVYDTWYLVRDTEKCRIRLMTKKYPRIVELSNHRIIHSLGGTLMLRVKVGSTCVYDITYAIPGMVVYSGCGQAFVGLTTMKHVIQQYVRVHTVVVRRRLGAICCRIISLCGRKGKERWGITMKTKQSLHFRPECCSILLLLLLLL